MSDKNEDIHLIILEEELRKNTQRVLTERTREKPKQLTAPVRLLALPEKLEQFTALSQTNESTGEEQESGLGITGHARSWMEPLKSVITDLILKVRNSWIALGMVVCSFISVGALLWLGVYASGNQFGPGPATSMNVIVLGIFWSMILTAALFQRRVLRADRKRREHARSC
jgi:hypothetical protein